MSLQNVADVRSALDTNNYLASDGLATAVFLAISLNRPLLLEGEAGVGKTELAKVLASIRNSELIRLQCYEGLDESKALYEWNYKKQLLRIQADKKSWLLLNFLIIKLRKSDLNNFFMLNFN